MSVYNLLAASRASGPARVTEFNPDGTIARQYERPARPVWKAGRLSDEERLALLTQTGNYPETLPPESLCGIQANDLDFHSGGSKRDGESLRRLHATGVMAGPVDCGVDD